MMANQALRKKIIFDGAYGIRSFGDDAPLIVLVELLRQRLGEIDGVVVNRHMQDYDYSDYGLRSICGIEYQTKEQAIGKWFRGFNPNDERDDLCRLYQEIESSDLLVLGAGNFLVDYSIDILKGSIPRFLVMSLMAEMTGTPIFWFGMSVGPLNTKIGRDMSRLAARMATVITVRDEKSITELNRLGVEKEIFLLPDAALGLRFPAKGHGMKFPAYRNAHSGGDPVIAVSVRSMPSGAGLSTDDYIKLMSETCNCLIEKYRCNVLFIPQCPYEFGNHAEDDRNIAAEVIKRSGKKEKLFSVEEKMNAYDCLSLYERAMGAVCTRLHGNVFSIRHGVPTVGLNYNPKVLEFYKWLGCEEYAMELGNLSETRIVSALDDALRKRNVFAENAEKIMSDGVHALGKYADHAITAMAHKKSWLTSAT
ncbi:MAG: polysaccharide pyruvyl transferase family protein [Gallionella sp.]|nr:polysaccharide pyruvyl transferase family protein [Gallionella sp.]